MRSLCLGFEGGDWLAESQLFQPGFCQWGFCVTLFEPPSVPCLPSLEWPISAETKSRKHPRREDDWTRAFPPRVIFSCLRR